MTDDNPVLLTETPRPGVRLLTMNRPAQRNALNGDLINALGAALADADADESIFVIVLTGADPAFSAGLDLKALGDGSLNITLDPWIALQKVSKPTIAACNGAAATGGLELALCCDFMLAGSQARFADTHAKVGLVPGGGMTPLLTERVGLPRAKEMSLTGRWVDAVEAEQIGLANRTVPADELVDYALDTAEGIANGDRRALTAILALYNDGAGTPRADWLKMERQRFAEWAVSADQIESRRSDVIKSGSSATSA
ncbi:MAG: enoyl-CoA hydratase [Actinobacteria bacterium]|nr:enoyl-CoA hydratase [Actinomycetota bacterium]MCB9390514.1 enoyl-CoA hydratase [Acidimicrobiia bacterium]